MKCTIKHLLNYLWQGPSIGVRVKGFRQDVYNCDVGVIIPIPQWFSNLLLRWRNK